MSTLKKSSCILYIIRRVPFRVWCAHNNIIACTCTGPGGVANCWLLSFIFFPSIPNGIHLLNGAILRAKSHQLLRLSSLITTLFNFSDGAPRGLTMVISVTFPPCQPDVYSFFSFTRIRQTES